MAITASGIGSGLDIAGLVASLVSAEGDPQTARLDSAVSTANAQISALGTLRGALSNMTSALAQLKTAGSFAKRTASTSDAAVFTASAGSTASPGNFAVEVNAIARAHRLASAGFTSAASPVGTGQLTIANGAHSIAIDIDSSGNSLTAIRDAINGASGNTFVNASIVNASDGSHLVLSARETGAANALRITQSGGDGGLSALVFDPGVSEQLVEKSPALDASITVDGFTHTSADNTIDGVIDGVTINTLKAEVGVAKTLTVSRDDESVRKAVSGFVTAYNIVKASISTTTRYNAATRTASALTGDALPRSIDAQLRAAVGSVRTSGTLTALNQAGVSFAADGTLKFEQATLDKALSSDAAAVADLFAGPTGFATKLDGLVTALTSSGGMLASRTESLNNRLRGIDVQRTALSRRLADIEDSYRTQFTALDSLVARMKQTSSYLSSQLG